MNPGYLLHIKNRDKIQNNRDILFYFYWSFLNDQYSVFTSLKRNCIKSRIKCIFRLILNGTILLYPIFL